MKLEDLGYTQEFENYRKNNRLDSFEVGRVVLEHKERYVVKTADKELDAEVIGNLRYTAQSRADFPAVGDWVAVSEFDDDKGIIHAIFKRDTVLERQAIGKQGDKQIIAANINYAFIVQAVDRDFSINRIERYLTICNNARVEPIIVLNKIDLLADTELDTLLSSVINRISNVPVFAVSNTENTGVDRIKTFIEKGKTYCLLGSSGVGKSTLLNVLLGDEIMRTDVISESSNRGRHVTTHRELKVLKNGGIIIDNPGMREVGVTETEGGIELTFDKIAEFSEFCKYSDCSHTNERGCAVIAAVENDEIDRSSYQNYLKIEREKEHFEMTVAEKRKKDKDFGKMVKRFKNIKNNKK